MTSEAELRTDTSKQRKTNEWRALSSLVFCIHYSWKNLFSVCLGVVFLYLFQFPSFCLCLSLSLSVSFLLFVFSHFIRLFEYLSFFSGIFTLLAFRIKLPAIVVFSYRERRQRMKCLMAVGFLLHFGETFIQCLSTHTNPIRIEINELCMCSCLRSRCR